MSGTDPSRRAPRSPEPRSVPTAPAIGVAPSDPRASMERRSVPTTPGLGRASVETESEVALTQVRRAKVGRLEELPLERAESDGHGAAKYKGEAHAPPAPVECSTQPGQKVLVNVTQPLGPEMVGASARATEPERLENEQRDELVALPLGSRSASTDPGGQSRPSLDVSDEPRASFDAARKPAWFSPLITIAAAAGLGFVGWWVLRSPRVFLAPPAVVTKSMHSAPVLSASTGDTAEPAPSTLTTTVDPVVPMPVVKSAPEPTPSTPPSSMGQTKPPRFGQFLEEEKK